MVHTQMQVGIGDGQLNSGKNSKTAKKLNVKIK
jgi:hypothetical protein